MTVIIPTNKTRQAGDGVKVAFDFDFQALDENDLQVYLVDALDVKTLQTITTHYTVFLNPITEGGTVTFFTAPAISPLVEDVLVVRVLPLTQPTDIPNVGGVHESQLENEYDRSRMIDQQLQETQLRTIQFDIADSSAASTVLPPLEIGKILGNTGTILVWVDPTTGFAGRLFFGLDASKSVSPLVNDVHFATDTRSMYLCSTVGVWRLMSKRDTAVSLTVVANSVNTDLNQGETFDFTASANFTLENPTNPPVSGQSQKVVWRIKQDPTGGRIIMFGSKFRISADIGATIVLSTGPNKLDYLGAIYNQADDKYDVVALRKDIV